MSLSRTSCSASSAMFVRIQSTSAVVSGSSTGGATSAGAARCSSVGASSDVLLNHDMADTLAIVGTHAPAFDGYGDVSVPPRTPVEPPGGAVGGGSRGSVVVGPEPTLGAVDGHRPAVRQDPVRLRVPERDPDHDDRVGVVGGHGLERDVALGGAMRRALLRRGHEVEGR